MICARVSTLAPSDSSLTLSDLSRDLTFMYLIPTKLGIDSQGTFKSDLIQEAQYNVLWKHQKHLAEQPDSYHSIHT